MRWYKVAFPPLTIATSVSSSLVFSGRRYSTLRLSVHFPLQPFSIFSRPTPKEDSTSACCLFRCKDAPLVPHGQGAVQFPLACPSRAPRLWGVIGDRTTTQPGASKWHAEDMALHRYEDSRASHPISANEHYPEGAYIATYGRRFKYDTLGFKEPCTGTEARITPDCRSVLNKLRIEF